MHYSKSAALVAAFAAISTATPVDLETLTKRSSFSIQQVAVPKKAGWTPQKSVLKTYAKYGVAPPQYVVDAAAASSGSVAANPEAYDASYLCSVTVGNTQMNLDFDTGSADLWVFSALQPSSQTGQHTLYDTSSGTLKSGYSWKISYGDQSGASGRVYADKVVVGGVTATSQAVEAATSVSSQFVKDVDNDGLLGLAFSSINTVSPTKQTTFFDTVKSTLAAKLFAVRLRKGAAGSYDFGKIDASKYTGALTYVAADSSQGFWGFTAGSYAVGSGAATGSIGASIADTGTSLLYLPDAAVTAYYKSVSSAKFDSTQGGYTFSCSATLPNFTVKIGTGSITIPGSYMNFAPLTAGSSTCFGGIQSNSGLGLTIFGDIFLKAAYVVFDQSTGSNRLGFAQGA